MKKLLSLILALVLLSLCLVACDADGSGQDTEHVHEYADATCKDPQKCTCGYTKGEPLNAHTFEKGVCAVCEKELIDELGRLARKDNEQKKEQNQSQLYSVSGESMYVTDTDIVSVSTSMGEYYPSPQDKEYSDGYTVTLTITQESLTSGIYKWELRRSVYVKESNYYKNTYMFGTITAAEFSAGAALTLTDNGEYTAFTEAEKPDYMSKASKQLNLIVKDRLPALLAGNESGLTVADLGFANYK